jgi:hypothetical protein
MKLDIFNHIFPKGFYDKMLAVAPNQKDMGKRVRNVPVPTRLWKFWEALKFAPSLL